MTNLRRTLPAYGKIKPYQQGQLSSLCGIYAAINAARLISPERATSRVLWAGLYHHAVDWLSKDDRLKRGLIHGLSFDTWKEMQHTLYDFLSERLGTSYHMRPLLRRSSRRRSDLSGYIREAIDANWAVLCALTGALDHYSVIAGYTSSRWLLHDSYGYRWVDMAVTSIGGSPERRHMVPLPSIVVLYRAEEQS